MKVSTSNNKNYVFKSLYIYIFYTVSFLFFTFVYWIWRVFFRIMDETKRSNLKINIMKFPLWCETKGRTRNALYLLGWIINLDKSYFPPFLLYLLVVSFFLYLTAVNSQFCCTVVVALPPAPPTKSEEQKFYVEQPFEQSPATVVIINTFFTVLSLRTCKDINEYLKFFSVQKKLWKLNVLLKCVTIMELFLLLKWLRVLFNDSSVMSWNRTY